MKNRLLKILSFQKQILNFDYGGNYFTRLDLVTPYSESISYLPKGSLGRAINFCDAF